MGNNEQADPTPHAAAADPYGIGAGGQIGQDDDSDHDGLTDAFEKFADTSATLADTDADGLLNSYETVSSHTSPLRADGDFDDLTDGPEMSYQSDPLSDIHSGPWNQGLPGGPQPPDQGGLGGPQQPNQGGFGAPHLDQGGIGAPQPDQGGMDPAGSDHLDNAGGLDLN
jgi:hypothetical protein